MKKDYLAMIAKECIDISRKGFYIKDGKKIKLKDYCVDKNFDEVIVINNERSKMIKKDLKKFYKDRLSNWKFASINVENKDSFECARKYDNVLVMNFANARNPGGGFLNGARAQEESLCRCSTLYQSINSSKASEMYAFNNSHRIKTESDYMLLSPNVCVFRDSSMNLLDEPYQVGVITVPAPNRNGNAHGVSESKIESSMVKKIRKMIGVAIKYGYRNLVLGAWGCGAFGNSSEDVAYYFFKVLIEEEKARFFENISFAILNDKNKFDDFSFVFCCDMEEDFIDEDSEGNNELDRIINYIEYICEKGLLEFTSNIHNGHILILKDKNGLKYAYINVFLEYYGKEVAVSNLKFREFDKISSWNRDRFRVIKPTENRD